MSREIDERLVAMYFDNSQFERGAKQTIKTMEELKTSLDMEGMGESLSTVAKATEKTFGKKNTKKTLGVFTKSLNMMGKAAKTAFRITTAPLRPLTNSLRTLGSYTRKVLGFDLGQKLVSTGENLVRAFTVDPLKSGWNEYELKMDSIKTILTGTKAEFKKTFGEDYTEEMHLEKVKEALEELNKYADKTVYSFRDMTSNIGKFTNNGVKLNDAVSAMKGISNAAALAGQGTQQASMAMYNLAQAIGVGKLTKIDWKSIETANMATVEFKQSFMDVAVAMGNLEKIGNKYYIKEDKQATALSNKKKKLTKEEQDAALKAREVTVENFANTLHKGWADSTVITRALGIFSGDVSDDILASWGFNPEQIKQLRETGDAANKAATEVRTFSKMMDALKESAQSGWAISWEYIFGDVNEATAFWTDLNTRFSGILDAISDKRNKILEEWRGLNKKITGYRYQTQTKTKTTKDKKGKKHTKIWTETVEVPIYEETEDGRKILIDSLNRLLDTIQLVSEAIKKAWSSVFGEMDGKKLLDLTKGFSDFTERLKTFFGSMDDPKSNIAKLTHGLTGIFRVAKLVGDVFKFIGEFVWSLMGPAITWLIERLDKFATIMDSGLFKGNLAEVFGKIVKKIKSLTATKILKWLKETGAAFGDFFGKVKEKAKTFLRDQGFGGVVDWLSNAKKTIVDAWNSVVESIRTFFKTNSVGQFIVNTWEWLKNLAISIWGTATNPETWDNVKKWIEGAYTTISGTWNTVSQEIVKWINSDGIGSFITDAWGWISEKAVSVYNYVTNPETWNNFGSILNEAWTFISGIWETVKNYVTNPETWNNFGSILNEAWTSISATWETVKKEILGWIDSSGIGKFFVDTWNYIVEQFTGKQQTSSENESKPAEEMAENSKVTSASVAQTASFFDTIIGAVSSLVDKVKGWDGWATIGEFFHNFWNDLTETGKTFKDKSVLGQVLNLVDRFARFILAIIDKILSLGESTLQGDYLPAILTALAVLVAKIGTIIYYSKLSQYVKGTDSFATSMLKIAASIAIIAAAIAGLGAIPEDIFWSGVGRILGIAIVLGGLVAAIRKLENTAESADSKDLGERASKVLNKLISMVGIVATLWIAMEKLPAIIKAFSDVDATKFGAVKDTMLGLAGLIGAIGIIFVVLAKVNVSPQAVGYALIGIVGMIASVFLTLNGIVLTVYEIGALIEGLGTDKVLGYAKTVKEFFQSIGELLGSFVGGFAGGKDAAYMEETTKGMVKAGEIAKDIDEEGISKLSIAMQSLKTIGDNLPKDATPFEQFFTGKIKFKDVGDMLTSLVNGMYAASVTAKGFVKDQSLLDAFKKVFDTLESLFAASEFFAKYKNFSGSVQDMIGTLKWMLTNPITKNYDFRDGANQGSYAINSFKEFVEDVVSLFNVAILESAPQVDATPIFTAMLTSLEDTSAEGQQRLISSLQKLLGGFNFSSVSGSLNPLEGMSGLLGGIDLSSFQVNGSFDAGKFLGIDLSSDDPGGINSVLQGVIDKVDLTAYQTKGQTMMSSVVEGMKEDLKSETIKATISPVWDETSIPPMLDLGNEEIKIVGTVKLDTTDLTNIKNTIVDQTTRNMQQISLSARELGARIDHMSTAIANIRFVLDTGVIAGAVDQRLGITAAKLSRTSANAYTNYMEIS